MDSPGVLTQGRKFCGQCGSAMALSAAACPHCGTQQTAEAFSAARAAAQPAPAASKSNGLAIASLVLGILWLGWLGSVLAVIFGHVAHKQISDAEGRQSGKGMATAGLVLGYIGIATLVILFALGLMGAIIANATSGLGMLVV